MDQRRLDELTAKRHQVGLTADEANELGRLLAETAGQPYGNAQSPPPEVAAERDSLVDEPAEEEAREAAEDPDRDTTAVGPSGAEPPRPTRERGGIRRETREPDPPERHRPG